MLHAIRFAVLAMVGVVVLQVPAAATDNAFELWINPSGSFGLNGDTGVEIETAQRFRSARTAAPTPFMRVFGSIEA